MVRKRGSAAVRRCARGLGICAVLFRCGLAIAQNAPTSQIQATIGGIPAGTVSPKSADEGRAGARGAPQAARRVTREGGPPPSVTQLASVQTASPAVSFAINGNLAYVCDNNEVSVVDISNPSNLKILSTALSGIINNSGAIYCAIQRGALTVFSDQTGSTIGNTPGYSSFSLANPTQPQLLADVPVNKRFFREPVYIGNFAFVPTGALSYQFAGWDNSYGDVVSVDLTTLASPVVRSTLEQPQISSQLGGPNYILGAAQAEPFLLYVAGSSSTGTSNNGEGFLRTVDVSNPLGMQTVGQILVPGTKQLYTPLIQGDLAIALGNSGGWGNNGVGLRGNIVVTVFDIGTRREPAILSINATSFVPNALGVGATQIGANQFAFSGAQDASGNNVLLLVDVSNPQAPSVTSVPAPLFLSMQAVGNVLYATLGAGGFATYSIPGIFSAPASVCPAFVDAMLIVDQGAAIPIAALDAAKTALESFVSDLQLTSDLAGVASFTTTAIVQQTLTHNGPQATAALNSINGLGGGSYIGAGIAAARAELTGPRQNTQATPVMVIVSDGADSAAPSVGATLAAANAAKAAGIRIISIQYGSNSNGLMQSIASSSSDYHVVGQ